MRFLVFVTPFFSDDVYRALKSSSGFPNFKVALISEEPTTQITPSIRKKLIAYHRIKNTNDVKELLNVIRQLTTRFGSIDYLLGDAEQTQIPLAKIRTRLGIQGMSLKSAQNFRNKAQMKKLLMNAGLPCAKHCVTRDPNKIIEFATEVGFPLVLKPLEGMRSEKTLILDSPNKVKQIIRRVAKKGKILVEEYIQGAEYSCESFFKDGKALWHSTTNYLSTPLEAKINRKIKWRLVLPGVDDKKKQLAIGKLSEKAGIALGIGTGMTHMEWFLRKNGEITISEIAARPPAALIPRLISFAYDIDCIDFWMRLMVLNNVPSIPKRKYCSSAIFLRAESSGKIASVRGIRKTLRSMRNIVVAKEIPWTGQQSSLDYDGDGHIILRDKKKHRLEKAMMKIEKNIEIKILNR